jgi:hypothetical protein
MAALAAFGITAGVILADYGLTEVPWSDVARPILLAAVASGVIGLACSWLPWPGVATVVTVAIVVGVARPGVAIWVLAAMLAWVALRRWSRILLKRGDGSAGGLALGVAVLAGVFLVVNLVTAVSVQGMPTLAGQARADTSASGGSSVYLLLLDGYPRSDTLLEDFGYDNEPFLRALEARGFAVDRQSESLYPRTNQAVAYLFGVDVEAFGRPSPQMRRGLRNAAGDGPLLHEWTNAGYDVEIIRQAIGQVVVPGSIDTGQANEFEISLLGNSLLAPLLHGWVVAQQDDRLKAAIATLEEFARRDVPQVVLAHLLAPHPPFLLRPAPDCWPECGLFGATGLTFKDDRDAYAAAVRQELDYINPLILEAIDQVIEADPDACIVVFSDHGNRHRGPGSAERHRNLSAIRGSPSVRLRLPVVSGAAPG